jgi:hypothetical protein
VHVSMRHCSSGGHSVSLAVIQMKFAKKGTCIALSSSLRGGFL